MATAIPHPMVRVSWKDAHGGMQSGWRALEDVKRATSAACVSVGYLIREDAAVLVVCPHLVVDPM